MIFLHASLSSCNRIKNANYTEEFQSLWLKPQWTQRILCLPINWNKVSPYYIFDINLERRGCTQGHTTLKSNPLPFCIPILTEKVPLRAFVYLLLKSSIPFSFFHNQPILWTNWQKGNCVIFTWWCSHKMCLFEIF